MNTTHLIHQRLRSLTIDIASPVKYLFHGGKETFDAAAAFAAKEWSPEQSRAFNQILGSADAAQIDIAVQGLMAAYTVHKGPTLVGGKALTHNAAKPFASEAEKNAALYSRQYDSDPRYRAQVLARLRATK